MWLAPFVGRERELAELADAVREHRLVTLVGPCGVGKSRLAAALAQRGGASAWWTDLAALAGDLPALLRADARLVVVDGSPPTAGVSAGPAPVAPAPAALADAAARLVAATDAAVVVTSRRPLAVAGEQRWPVRGLCAREAKALFLARLRETEPRAVVDRDALAALCAALDGVPLALEVAADHARAAGLRELVTDLGRLLPGADHAGGAPDAGGLAAMVDDVRASLSPDARAALRHLRTVHGPFPAQLAEALAWPRLRPPAVRGALVELVDAGLLHSRVEPSGPVFQVPRTTALVVDHLATGPPADELRTRGRQAVASMLGVAVSHLHGPDAGAWLRLAGDRAADTDAALEHARRGRGALTGLVDPLAEIWFWTGDHARGTGWTRDPGADAWPTCATEAGVTRAARAAVLAGDVRAAVDLSNGDGSPPRQAYRACAELLATGRGAGDVTRAVDGLRGADGAALLAGLTLAGEVLALVGDAPASEAAWAEAHAMVDRVDDAAARGRVLAGLAATALALARTEQAHALARRAATAARRTGDEHARVHAEIVLSRCAAAAGDWTGALERLRRAWARRAASGLGLAAVPLQWALVELAVGTGRALGPAHLRSDVDGPFLTATRSVLLARHHLGDGRLDAAHDLARDAASAFGPTGAAAWSARTRHVLGDVALAAGDLATARRELRAAIRTGATGTDPALLADCVDGLARVAWGADERAQARRLLAASDRWRAGAGWCRSPRASDLLRPMRERAASPPGRDEEPTGSEARGPRPPRRLTPHDLVALALGRDLVSSSPRDDAAPRLDALSPAEREVSRLVAAGRSNAEVGRELFMSLSTVKTHLSHAYRKLAVTSRAQLAYLVAEQEAHRHG